jgi:hypothetical protein
LTPSLHGVHYRNTGLTDFLENALANHGTGLAEVTAIQRLHVMDGQAAIVERHQRRFCADIGN